MTYLTWQNDLYPHIRKVFDIRLSKNLDILNQFCDVRTDYKNFPNAVYHESVTKQTVTFKKVRTTYGETSKKIGTFLADAIAKDMYKDFYRLFTRAFFTMVRMVRFLRVKIIKQRTIKKIFPI